MATTLPASLTVVEQAPHGGRFARLPAVPPGTLTVPVAALRPFWPWAQSPLAPVLAQTLVRHQVLTPRQLHLLVPGSARHTAAHLVRYGWALRLTWRDGLAMDPRATFLAPIGAAAGLQSIARGVPVASGRILFQRGFSVATVFRALWVNEWAAGIAATPVRPLLRYWAWETPVAPDVPAPPCHAQWDTPAGTWGFFVAPFFADQEPARAAQMTAQWVRWMDAQTHIPYVVWWLVADGGAARALQSAFVAAQVPLSRILVSTEAQLNHPPLARRGSFLVLTPSASEVWTFAELPAFLS